MYTQEQLDGYRKQVQPLIDQGRTPRQIMDMTQTELGCILVNDPGAAFTTGSKAQKLMAIKNILVALYPADLTGYEPQIDKAKLDKAMM